MKTKPLPRDWIMYTQPVMPKTLQNKLEKTSVLDSSAITAVIV